MLIKRKLVFAEAPRKLAGRRVVNSTKKSRRSNKHSSSVQMAPTLGCLEPWGKEESRPETLTDVWVSASA